MKEKSSRLFSEAQELLKDKSILYAVWRGDSNEDHPYHNWRVIFEKLFGKFIAFDTAKTYFRYGKKETNKRFLKIVQKDKPDYIFFSIVYDEFDLQALQAIKKISPSTKMIALISDDDWRFEDYSRYYAPLFDYTILMHDVRKEYKKEGIKNVIFWYWAFNCEVLKPLNLEKKYDVTFIGSPRASRFELVKYLIDNGINIHIWGDGWAKYPELKGRYHGTLSTEDFVKVINQSRINMNFSMGGHGEPQVKGRPWEIASCGSFALVERCEDFKKFFKEDKEIAMFNFNDKEDMLKKVKYYLAHEKEREEIAKKAYNKTILFHNQIERVSNFFKETINDKPFPYIEKYPLKKNRFLALSHEDLMKNREEIVKKIKNSDYIYFKDKKNKQYKYREFLQAYSLEKTGKDISCCDYYVNSPILENYLLFKVNDAFNKLKMAEFTKVVNLYQLMFKKDYFIENLDKIKAFAMGGKSDIFSKETTACVAVPLIEMNYIPKEDYKIMKSIYQMKFLDQLYSLYFQKKLFFSLYPYALFFKSLFGNRFILRNLYETLRDKGKIGKLKRKI